MTVAGYASVDHLIGQTAKDVLGDGWNWSIQMESGVVISNKDEERTEAPEDVKGKVLLTVMLSELDTRLLFGITTESGPAEEIEVTLTPTQYTLGGMEGQEEEYYPQAAPTLEDTLPPDPSDERVATGPTTPLEGSESAVEATEAADGE